MRTVDCRPKNVWKSSLVFSRRQHVRTLQKTSNISCDCYGSLSDFMVEFIINLLQNKWVQQKMRPIFCSCLRDSRSIWKHPWQTSLLSHDSAPGPAKPKGALPLVQLESFQDQDPVPQSGLLERSEGLQQVCAKMAKFKHSSWTVMLNEERNLAVNKWLRIVLVEPLAFGVARNFYKDKASGLCQGTLADSVVDCLAIKATSTLHARANALIRYMAWARSKVSVIFPPVEAAVYAYFEDNQAKMGATSFKSAISAFAFAKFVLGMEGAEVIYLSGRVTGLAAKLFLTKAKLRQRNPLRVRDVKLLERICVGLEGKSKPRRVASGFFLFLVMARARYSDGQNVVSLTINGNFLEARTARSKTSFTLERKTRFLPMAASIEGIGCDWVKEWLDLLSDTGVVIDADHLWNPVAAPQLMRRRLTIQVTKHLSNKSLNGMARWTLIVSTVSTPSLGTSNPGTYMF